MKIKDLKDKMVIVCRNGERFMVVGDLLISDTGYMGIDDYDDNLINHYTEESDTEWDITTVLKAGPLGFGLGESLAAAKEVIWDRNKEIDWEKVPKWTKVKVIYGEGKPWRGAYFLEAFEPLNKYAVSFHDKFVFENGTNNTPKQ